MKKAQVCPDMSQENKISPRSNPWTLGCFDHQSSKTGLTGDWILRETEERIGPKIRTFAEAQWPRVAYCRDDGVRKGTTPCYTTVLWWKGMGIFQGIGLYEYIYIYFRDTQSGKMVVNKNGPFFRYQKKNRIIQGFSTSSKRRTPLRYDSVAFQADAEQQLELHGPRLLAAALVP